jgi:hypothetical protein
VVELPICLKESIGQKLICLKESGGFRRFRSHWKAQIEQLYWGKTLGKTLYTDPNSGELRCGQGGDSIIAQQNSHVS